MTFVYNMKSGAHSHRQAQVTSRVALAMYTIIAMLPALWLFGLPSLPLSVVVPPEIQHKLLPEHKHFIYATFGVFIM